VLVLADVEITVWEMSSSLVDFMVRATTPGSYSDVIEKAFFSDELDDGNREKSLAVRSEMLEASGDAWRCVCAHLTLLASHMVASLGAESKKELSVLMRLPGGRMGDDHMTLSNSPGELLPGVSSAVS
jgi:hypothetical protein